MAQPQLQLWSLIPGVGVAVSGIVPIIFLVVRFVPGLIAGLSTDESSSAPALADSGGIFPFEVFVASRWFGPVH